jgi:hypothetical protein
MTSIAKDFASKAVVAFVASAMVFTMFAPSAKAQSTADLEAQIKALMAQIEALRGGNMGSGPSAGVCPFTWTRDLRTGSTGADVKALQQFLNADAETRVAATGAGSAGMETETFGPMTAAAVSKFQTKYRADILTPNGLVSPTGTFGPSSRAKANALCVAPAAGDDDEDEGMDDEDESEDEDDAELSGEASLDTFEIDNGESTINEGDEDAVVAELNVEFTDGDAEISRMDVVLEADAANTEKNPWDVFETVSLWVDGEKVAEVDASDEDEYLDEDEGSLRFSDLGIVAMEDEEMEVLVGVTVQGNLDGMPSETWTVAVDTLRFFDADGVATTEETFGELDDTVEFDIEEEGADEEIKISLASSNPDSTDVVVDTDSDTNDVTVMVAELEAEDSDIELNKLVVRVDTGSASTSKVVDEARVVIDGEEFKAEAVSGTGAPTGNNSTLVTSAGTSTWYVFDIDGDVVVEADGSVDMEVVIDFNDTDDGNRYPNGTTIKASVTSVERNLWQAEGADDLGTSQFTGTAVGDQHTLVGEGILVPVSGFSAEVDTLGQNDTIGEFVLEFEVTAVESDFYIREFASTSATDRGVQFTVDGAIGTGSVSASLTSTADEDTPSVYTVREGETETFTLTVTVDPQTTGTFRVQLDEIFYSADTDGINDGAGGEDGVYVPTPVSDFRTTSQAIQGS